jgi:hypothetical protein
VASRDPDVSGRSVVLVGNFNPAIFHPQWFARTGLVPEEEASTATLELTAPQVSKFSINWFECQVTLDNFQVSTLQAEMEEPLRDLVVGTFALLPHTPVWAFGLNSDCHFSLPSVDVWHKLGHRLSPKEIWDGLLEDPGTRAVAIQGRRSDGVPGATLVRVEPSLRVHPGLYIGVNDHFDLRPDALSTWEESVAAPIDEKAADSWTGGATDAVAAIESEWSGSCERAHTIMQGLIRQA